MPILKIKSILYPFKGRLPFYTALALIEAGSAVKFYPFYTLSLSFKSLLLYLSQVLVGTRNCFELLRRDEPSVKVFTLPQGSGGAVSAIQVTQRHHGDMTRLRDDLTREAHFTLPQLGQLQDELPNVRLS